MLETLKPCADANVGDTCMPVEMSDADHAGLDATLSRILRAYSDGACDADEARAALAHMMCALAIGNEAEFIRWCAPGPVER